MIETDGDDHMARKTQKPIVTTVVVDGIEHTVKKCCGPCGMYRPLNSFAKMASGIAGRRPRCLKCERDYMIKYR